jgi:hypothetical protein
MSMAAAAAAAAAKEMFICPVCGTEDPDVIEGPFSEFR